MEFDLLTVDLDEFISLDGLLAELLANDSRTRLPGEHGNRGDLEANIIARMTLLRCGFALLRPVKFWHPMAELTDFVDDTSDEFFTSVIQVLLGGSSNGNDLCEIRNYLKDRVVLWPRVLAVGQLAMSGLDLYSQSRGDSDDKALSAQSPEKAADRRKRRLARLVALGGHVRAAGKGWHLGGERGAMATLVREEKRAGRRMADRKNVLEDVIRANRENLGS